MGTRTQHQGNMVGTEAVVVENTHKKIIEIKVKKGVVVGPEGPLPCN